MQQQTPEESLDLDRFVFRSDGTTVGSMISLNGQELKSLISVKFEVGGDPGLTQVTIVLEAILDIETSIEGYDTTVETTTITGQLRS